MRPSRAPTGELRTQLCCERTDGYNVKRGASYRDWCPFCGHPTDDGSHEFVVSVQR